ncbi:MAG: hypothetical protein AAF585_13750 [Verrucomicrobiota bacterium]
MNARILIPIFAAITSCEIAIAEPARLIFDGGFYDTGDYFLGQIELKEKEALLKWEGVKGNAIMLYRNSSDVPKHNVKRELRITDPEMLRIIRGAAENLELFHEGPSSVIGSGLSVSAYTADEEGILLDRTHYFHTSIREQRCKRMERFIFDLKSWVDELESDQPAAADWEVVRSAFGQLGECTDAYLELRAAIHSVYESGKSLRLSDLPIPAMADEEDLPKVANEGAEVLNTCLNKTTLSVMLDHPAELNFVDSNENEIELRRMV